MQRAVQAMMDDEQFAAHEAHEAKHWWFTARRRIVISFAQKLLDGYESPTVLDIGCGTGGTVAELSRFYRTIGVDPSPAAILRARRRYPHCVFVEGAAPEAVSEHLVNVSLVTMMDILEHVADDESLLRANVLAARPGTWFLITVPADMSLWSEHDVVLGHYRRYGATGLATLWRDLPVSCHVLAPMNTRLEPFIRLIRRMPAGLRFTRGAAGTDLRLPAKPVNELLHRIFSGEAKSLLRRLKERDTSAHGRGVSLLAVLRRLPHRDASDANLAIGLTRPTAKF